MNVPEIRFKGFYKQWESNTIGEISNSYSGGTPSVGCNEFYGGNIPFIRSGEIYNDTTELYLTPKGLYSSSAKIVDKGTILYALYGATSGEVNICKIRGAINQAILAIIPKKNINNYYLLSLLRNKKIEIIGSLLQGGQGNLSGTLIKKYLIFFPELPEQQKIASYFQSLDSLIQTTSKELASLKQIKAASLQSMFPQEGETVPKVRFKGFKGEWEKIQLNNCLNISNNINIHNTYGINDVLSISDEAGVVNQIEFLGRSFAGKSLQKYKILKTDQLVYTKSPLKAKPYGIIKNNSNRTGIVSTLYAIYDCKDNVSPEFIHYYFDPCYRINQYLSPLVNKGAKNTMNISDETALSGEIWIPSLQEQQKIASYFCNLDKQISLQTQRLEKLKQIKAACLDKMFV